MVKTTPSLLLVLLLAFPSHAQETEVINEKAVRYHGALEKRPGSGYLFDRFYNAWLDTGSLAELEKFLTTENEKPFRSTADALLLGFFHAKQGNDQLALETLARALEADPDNSAGWFEKAKISARNLNFEGAISDLERALEANPKSDLKIAISKFKGRLLVRSGKPEVALTLWQRLLSDNPDDEELHEDLVELQIDEGLFEEAIESLKALITRTRDPYEQVMRQLRVGDVYQRSEKREEALAAYEAGLRKSGSGAWIEKEILAQIEQIFRREDDLTGLAEHLGTLTSGEGLMRPALVQRRAQVLVEVKKTDEAIELFNELLARTPGNREIRQGYVELLRNAGKPDMAVDQVTELIKQNPDDAELLITLASLQNEAAQTDEALATLQTFLAKTENEETALLRVARLQEAFGNAAEAEATYRDLIARNPDEVTNREAFAAFLHRAGKREEAIEIWKDLAAAGKPDMVLRTARALVSRQENQAAFEVLQSRYDDLQNNLFYLARLCEVAIRLKKSEEAVEWALRRVQLADQAIDLTPAVRETTTILIQAGKADEIAKELAEEDPKTDQDRCLLAEIFEQRGQLYRIDELLQGDSALLVSQRIRILKLRGDWKSAADATRDLLLATSGRMRSSLLRDLVSLYNKAGLPEEAAKSIPDWKSASPGSIDPWLREAAIAEGQGGDAAAAEVLEAAARKFVENVEIRSKLASAYQKSGRGADARRIFTNLYDESGQLSDKLRWIRLVAIIARDEGKIDQLIGQFEERRRNNRGSIAPLLSLAEIHRANFDYAERRKALMEASRIRSGNLELILEIAEIEESEGQWRDALKSLERARALEDSPRIVRRMAALQLQYGKNDAETMRRLRELGAESNVGSFLQLALAIANRRDWNQLNEYLASRAGEFPDDYRIHYLRAIALEELSENRAAAEAYLRVLEIQAELPSSARTGLRSGTKPSARRPPPPSYGKRPGGMMGLIDYATEASFAYLHRTGGAVILPNDLESAHSAALAHLAQLRRLDELETDQIDQQIRSIGGEEAVVLAAIDFDPAKYEAKLRISEELLARNAENLALHAYWLCKNSMDGMGDDFYRDGGKPGPIERYKDCFRLFEKEYPGYAVQAGFEAMRHQPEEGKEMLGDVLRVLEENPGEPFIIPAAMALLRNGNLKLTDDQQKYLDGRIMELGPAMKKGLSGRATEELFFRLAQVLGNLDDPAKYVNFLESRIAEVRKSPQPYKITVGNMLDSNLLKPLPFPPAGLDTLQLNRFPKEVIELAARDEHRLELPSWFKDPPKEKFESWFEVARDPILKFLFAVRIGKNKETLDALAKELETSPAVDAIAQTQLLAGWRAQTSEHAKVVAILEKARQLPMTSDVRKVVDNAIVNSAVELDRKDEDLEPLIEAGREAALRLASNRMKPTQRAEMIGAMRTLGMEEAAEKEEAANVSVSSITRASFVSYYTSANTSKQRERLARLLESGDREAAIQEMATQMRSMVPQVYNLGDAGMKWGRKAADTVARKAEENGLDEELLELFRTQASKSDVKQLEYAAAAILFNQEELAIEPIKAVLENHPDNASLKSFLAIMLIQRGEEAERIREMLTSMENRDFALFVYVLNERIPAGSVPLEDELRLFETLTPFIEKYDGVPNIAADWMVIYLKRFVGPWKTKDVSLGRLYQQQPGANSSKEIEEANARRWQLHDRMVEELWKVPKLAEIAFECESAGALSRGIAYDPAPKARQVVLTLKDIETEQLFPQDDLHSLSVRGPVEVLVREAFRKNDRALIDQEFLDEIRNGNHGLKLFQLLKDLTEVYFGDPDAQLAELQRRFPAQKVKYEDHLRNYGLTVGRSIAPLYQRIQGKDEAPTESAVTSNARFHTLIGHAGGVFEYDEAMNEIWSYPARYPYNAQRLPNGNTLIAEKGKDRVIEVNPVKKVVRQQPVKDVQSARQLPNGNWLISSRDAGVIEVDPEGKVVWKLKPPGIYFNDAIRLESGNTLVAEVDPNSDRQYVLAEYAPDGKIVWDISHLASIDTIQLLENGKVLVSNTNHKIIEYDRETKGALWALEVKEARAAHRTENGNLLIITQKPDNRFIEVTPDGQEVWSTKINNSSHGRISRFAAHDRPPEAKEAKLESPSRPEGPVKIFILAGQSNMEGHGKVEFGRNPNYDKTDPDSKREIKGGIAGLRHLATTPETADQYGHLLGKDAKWIERDDVWVHTTTSGRKTGKLTVGFGKSQWFGPELQFGHMVGDAIDEPVLLIKTAWGGHSLGVNFRPPSSGKPGYEETSFKEEDLGASYREMVRIVKDVRANLGMHFPELEGRKTEIIGLGWHQGWNDAGSAEMVGEYEENLKNLIRDLRKDLDVPDLPVVIANTGMIGTEGKGIRAELCEIQLELGDPKANPEFAGTIRVVETRPFKRSAEQSPSSFGYHWNHNAESHFLVGDAMGRAMVDLLKP